MKVVRIDGKVIYNYITAIVGLRKPMDVGFTEGLVALRTLVRTMEKTDEYKGQLPDGELERIVKEEMLMASQNIIEGAE